jgi:hypothetical protein
LRAFRTAVAMLAVLVPCAWQQAAAFEIVSDQRESSSNARLCLAVDQLRPVVAPKGAVIKVSGPDVPLSGTFYPVIVVPCDQPRADFPAQWRMTDTREFRIKVAGTEMCLSTRTVPAFEALIDPWLAAYKVAEPGSPYAYLARDYKADEKGLRQRRSPPLLVNPCGRSDAGDFFAYDPVNGTISTPRGIRACAGIYNDASRRPPAFEAGMPVNVTWCPELRSYARDGAPSVRWTLNGHKDPLPTYKAPDLATYFSGADGLPITGPMGRCLTAEGPSVVTSDCDGRVEQSWTSVGRAIRLGANGDCLALGGGGNVALLPCRDEPSQRWVYRVRDPVPNARWLNADVYGQIHPEDKPDGCLVTALDPFADPARQRNPVTVRACALAKPRQTSWFRPSHVRTLRLAVVRYANDDGSNPANGNATDEQVKRIAENLALRLSEYFARAGMRFVFDPDHDLLRVNDTIANAAKNRNSDNTANWDSPNRGSRIAGTTTYGKVTLVTMSGRAGGGSSGGVAEFEIARMIQHISRRPETSFHLVPGLPLDKNGMPAVSNHVAQNRVGDSIDFVSFQSHELGHYFGLPHTFNQDEFGDTPDDLAAPTEWEKAGGTACANPRTVTVNGKAFTPDRLNNEGYFACMIGRSHSVFTPMQLGFMSWMLDNQLNRYPLVACQPHGDANRVACENAESLALCRETAAYLKRRGGTSYVCELGGRYAREIATALRYPAVRYLLQSTSAGVSVINRLAGLPAKGGPPPTSTSNAVIDALKANKNLPLTMGMVNRLNEFRQAATKGNAISVKAGFVPGGPDIAADTRKVVDGLAAQVFTPGFIDKAPKIIGP